MAEAAGAPGGCFYAWNRRHSKKNFDDLRDVSPEDVHIQWRFAREVLGSPELGVSRFTYEPGARMPWGHPEGLDIICIGGREPEGGDTERLDDPWD
jgi:hypothetical protein